MGCEVGVDDLIDTRSVAEIPVLAHRNTLSDYLVRYDDMPRPVVDLGGRRSRLWLRSEMQPWAETHRGRADGRGRRRLVDLP